MCDTEQRLEYLEETVETLRMQNRVLGAAFNGLLRRQRARRTVPRRDLHILP